MLSVADVTVDAGTRVREEIDDAVVDEYVQRLDDGVWFPPVVVFCDGSRYCLADGFHRLEAFRKAGRAEIEATVYSGSRDAALWFALGASRAYGQRLTRADKWHAIGLVLRTWPDLSADRISSQLGCSRDYVAKVRAQSSLGRGPSRPSRRRPSQRARDRSNRIVSVVAFDAQNLLAQEDLIDFGALDRRMLSVWIADLDRAALDLARLTRRLREEASIGKVDTPGQVDDPSGED